MGPSPSPSVSATDSQCGQSAASDDFKTPNVYINGLPPNFPEDQLLAMTREFGEVVSVRTFTRHVSDRPSGYGFVLFGSVDAAEKCIETLRKYRNLHPSYSKRVHKIPGTMYASALPPSPADPAPGVSPSASESDTFKSRMERLQDTGSTNLYMEGLPMDINEPTLTALVSPYKIMSSRFFQTRLSVPARVIAFVRLESRTAAEEIIERLHGRMVRGWADAGCRISVRFADTSEQRELRRMERMNRDGDQSPSRLTVAQAALLNLKGGQLHTSPGMGNSSLPGLSPSFAVSPLPSVSGHSPSFHPVGLRGPGMVSPASSIPSPLEYEQLFAHGNVPLVPGDSFRSQHHLASRKMTPSPLPLQHHLDQHQRMQQFTQNSLPAIGHAGTNPAYVAHDHMLNSRAAELGPTLRIPPHLGSYDETSVLADPVGSRLVEESSAATRSQNGFTSLERDILQQYLQSQQLQQHILRQEQTGITRNVGPDGSLSAAGKANSVLLGRRLMNTLPSLSEEDFHAQAASGRSGGPPLATNSGVSVHLSPVTQTQPPSIPPSRLAMDDVNAKLNFTRQRNQTHTSGSKLLPRLDDGCNDGPDREGSEERTRCSTMPEDYSGRRSSDAFQGFSTATGAEVPKSSITNNSTNGVEHNSSTSQNDHRIKHHLDSTVRDTSPNHRAAHADTTCDVMADSINLKPSNTRIDTSPAALHLVPIISSTSASNVASTRHHASYHARGSSGSDGNVSPLDSPALSYSNSTRTPATLSPATPFSAFAEGPPFDGGVVVTTGNAREDGIKGEHNMGLWNTALRWDIEKDIPDLEGKVVIVTGGNAGLGFATIQHLVTHGAKIYMAARSEERAKAAIAKLTLGKGSVEWLELDLSDPREAKNAAERFLEKETRLDILVNCAAVTLVPYNKTKDDIQDIMVVNHISPFIWTRTLLPLMEKTAKEEGSDVRIVNFRNREDFNDEQRGSFAQMKRYARSKFVSALFIKELQKRLNEQNIPIICVSLHPGTVNTEGNLKFAQRQGWFLRSLFTFISHNFTSSPAQGAYTQVFAAVAPVVREQAEKYKGAFLMPPATLTKLSAASENMEIAKEVWDTTETLLKDIGIEL
ncbi:hypothetical protein EUX98_g6503 [Antrodiella citrinella]|uniref:RRM domain-containing protein n=1 Tax=Antrodiella citrinella TaxID=2447956 RepID=A0A4S4MNY6_9APHY|nr:hypothetical protein EUX98_g6503 [Antrodiella citrinella]